MNEDDEDEECFRNAEDFASILQEYMEEECKNIVIMPEVSNQFTFTDIDTGIVYSVTVREIE